jgi:hypothetical protein
MPDPDLHGNHDPCPACALRREALGPVPIDKGEVACNVCKGVGWLPLSKAEIVRRTCDEARRIYWPNWSAMNGLGVG